MSMETIATSALAPDWAPNTVASNAADPQSWPLLPVETEIYILPDGRVVVADLPAELAPLLAALGISDVTSAVANTVIPFPPPVPIASSARNE